MSQSVRHLSQSTTPAVRCSARAAASITKTGGSPAASGIAGVGTGVAAVAIATATATALRFLEPDGLKC